MFHYLKGDLCIAGDGEDPGDGIGYRSGLWIEGTLRRRKNGSAVRRRGQHQTIKENDSGNYKTENENN